MRRHSERLLGMLRVALPAGVMTGVLIAVVMLMSGDDATSALAFGSASTMATTLLWLVLLVRRWPRA